MTHDDYSLAWLGLLSVFGPQSALFWPSLYGRLASLKVTLPEPFLGERLTAGVPNDKKTSNGDGCYWRAVLSSVGGQFRQRQRIGQTLL
jgi:hypothetical protein